MKFVKQLLNRRKRAQVKDTLNQMSKNALDVYAEAIEVSAHSDKATLVNNILKKLKHY